MHAILRAVAAMPRDRLAELRQRSAENEEDDSPKTDSVVLVEFDGSLGIFFAQVYAIRHKLSELEAEITELTYLHRTLLSSAAPSSDTRQKEEILAGKVRADALAIRKQLHELQSHVDHSPTSTNARIEAVQETALTQRLQKALAAFSAEQIRYRDRLQDLLRAQLRIARTSLVERGAAEEEVQRLLDIQDQDQVTIFTDHIALNTLQVRQELADIQARQKEILTLERSITEMRDLFLDISLLVESQGDLIDRIENHVIKSVDHVETGHQQLASAKKKKSAARAKKIGLAVCLSVTILVLLLLLVIYLK